MVESLILEQNLNKLDSANDDPNTNGEMLVFNSLVEENNIVFDVGARDSLLPKIKNNLNFHLFEPIKKNYQRLVLEYGDFKNIKIINNCLSDKVEEVNIFLYTECINFRQGQPNESMGSEKINCITLENYINEHNIKHVDFLKIDVEGYEFNVIKGLGDQLKNVKNIMFEYGYGTYNSNNVNLSDLILLLKDFKFFIVQNKGLISLDFNKETDYNTISSMGYCNIFAKNINF